MSWRVRKCYVEDEQRMGYPAETGHCVAACTVGLINLSKAIATVQGWTVAVIIVALVAAFLVSTMAGCEGFLKWLTG